MRRGRRIVNILAEIFNIIITPGGSLLSSEARNMAGFVCAVVMAAISRGADTELVGAVARQMSPIMVFIPQESKKPECESATNVMCSRH